MSNIKIFNVLIHCNDTYNTLPGQRILSHWEREMPSAIKTIKQNWNTSIPEGAVPSTALLSTIYNAEIVDTGIYHKKKTKLQADIDYDDRWEIFSFK
jgi:hypothetical protein